MVKLQTLVQNSLFVLFPTNDGPKVKDLNDSSPPYLRQTASHSLDHPQHLVNEGGGPPGLPIPGSAPVSTMCC